VHELSIANAILAVAERHAGDRRVTAIRARVGRLRQVVPETLGFYLEIAARGTRCQGATLELERVDALLRCGACGEEWDPAPPPAREQGELVLRFRCPACSSAEHRVLSGAELLVESIDVEESGVGEGEDACTAPR
jgi:hydrogenase nickel incorporation protein HypA/HybF